MIATAASIMFASPRYGKLPDTEKLHVEARFDLMQRLDAAANKKQAFAQESLRTHNGVRLSVGAIRKLYYEKWVASGRDWESLINEARCPKETSGLEPATVEWWHQLCYRHGGDRRHKAAWRELRRAWRRGDEIPGLAEPAPRGRAQPLPAGLSYRNLMQKKYKPTKLADRTARIGLKAAASLLPGVLTTRAGLPFGARYMFDDMWHNKEVTVPGQLGGRRLLQFHCLELLSACQFARGYKPEILNDATGRFERLKERELLFLLAHVLCTVGYNAEGCQLMMEHGTANVAARVEDLLGRISGGAITVGRGSLSTGALAPGLYGGQSGGSGRFKAALESLGGFIQSESSDRLLLPADTGGNARLDRPEELHGRLAHLEKLQKAQLMVPEELREIMRLPAPPLWQAIQVLDAIQEEVNCRDDHDLEGWEACGFLLSEYRLSAQEDFRPATTLLQLPEPARLAIEATIKADPRLQRARRLSPREVFDGLSHTLTRLPAHVLPSLIGMEHAETRRVGKDGDFHFDDIELGADEHHFEGVCTDAEGNRRRLPAGEKFATFASSLDPLRMHLCDARGCYVGSVERITLASKADPHGFARAAGRKMAAHRELLAPVLAAARPLLKRMQQDIAINNAVLAHAEGARPASAPKAVQRARQDRRAALDAELAQAAQSTTTTEPAEGPLYDDSGES